jgi:hypothetical protein
MIWRAIRRGSVRSPGPQIEKPIAILESLTAILILAVCLALHVVVFDRAGGLWRDEANTVNLVTGSWARLYHLSGCDSFPMAWLVLVRAWISVAGQSDEALRFFGMLGGCLLIGCLWIEARRFGVAFPFVAMICVAVNPGVIYWGDSVRAYAFGGAMLTLLAGAFWRLSQSANWHTVAWALIFSLLAVGLQYTNCLFVAAVSIAACCAALRRSKRREAVVILAVAAVAALSMLVQIHALQWNRDNNSKLETTRVLWSDIWETFSATLGAGNSFMLWVWLSLLGLAILTAIVWQFLRRNDSRDDRTKDVLLYAATVILIATPFEILFFKNFDQVPKTSYYFGLLSVSALMTDVIFQPLLKALVWLRGMRTLAVVVLTIALTPSSWTGVHFQHSNIEQLADYLSRNATSRDLVVVQPWWLTVPFHYYYHGSASWVGLPDLADKSVDRLDLLKKAEETDEPCRPVFDRVAATLETGHTVWVVGGLQVLPTDQAVPIPMPAPDAKVGWFYLPYTRSWSFQFGRFMQQHAREAANVTVARDLPFDGMEVVPLSRVTGTQ